MIGDIENLLKDIEEYYEKKSILDKSVHQLRDIEYLSDLKYKIMNKKLENINF